MIHKNNLSWKEYKKGSMLLKQKLYHGINRLFLSHGNLSMAELLSHYVGHCWRSNDEIICDVLLWTISHRRANVARLTRTYLLQLCTNTGCSLEYLPGEMDDKDGWREEICACSVTYENDVNSPIALSFIFAVIRHVDVSYWLNHYEGLNNSCICKHTHTQSHTHTHTHIRIYIYIYIYIYMYIYILPHDYK